MPPPVLELIRAFIQDQFELGHSIDVILADLYGVSMRAL